MPSSAQKFPAVLLALLLGGLPAVPVLADGKVEPPVPVRTSAPDIPTEFSRAGGSGLVTVSFLVDEQGSVQDARVEKASMPVLEAPAIKAVRKWRFKPARKDGVAVAIRVCIPIKFEVE